MDLKDIIIGCAALIVAITTIITAIKKLVDKALEPINKSIKTLDTNQCKNYLVRFLKDIERKESMDDVEVQRAYEIYDHYTNDLHNNSYIHDKWNRLMKGDK